MGGYSASVCVAVGDAFNSLWVEAVLESVCFCPECPVSFSRGKWGEKGVFQGVIGLWLYHLLSAGVISHLCHFELFVLQTEYKSFVFIIRIFSQDVMNCSCIFKTTDLNSCHQTYSHTVFLFSRKTSSFYLNLILFFNLFFSTSCSCLLQLLCFSSP